MPGRRPAPVGTPPGHLGPVHPGPVHPGPTLDRRAVLSLLGIGAVGAALGGCGLSSDSEAGGTQAAPASPGALEPDKGTVNVLTWEGYTQEKWLPDYKARTGVEVKVTTAGSVDEMFAKAKAGGAGLDIAQFDLGSIPRYKDAGLIVPFDQSKVPNVTSIADGLPWKDGLTIDGQLWGLPYNWGTQPLMWNADVITTAPTSWAVLWDPQFKGRVTVPDDSYIGVAMVALAAGVQNPYTLSDQDFEAVKAKLDQLRPQLKTLTTGFDDAANLYGAGECVVGYCQIVAVVNTLNGKGKNFRYGYPDEGTPFWIDNSILLKGGNRKEVYDFVDFVMSRQTQSDFIASTGNAGIISYDVAKASVPADVLDATEVKNQTDPSFWSRMRPMVPPNDMDRRLAMWNEFKAGL